MNELGLAEDLPGLMMGVVAALEIPTMLLAAKLARRFSPAGIMAVALFWLLLLRRRIFLSSELGTVNASNIKCPVLRFICRNWIDLTATTSA